MTENVVLVISALVVKNTKKMATYQLTRTLTHYSCFLPKSFPHSPDLYLEVIIRAQHRRKTLESHALDCGNIEYHTYNTTVL